MQRKGGSTKALEFPPVRARITGGREGRRGMLGGLGRGRKVEKLCFSPY